MDEKRSVRMIIQPTVSHYRAPFIKAILALPNWDFHLFGRFQNLDEGKVENRILSANEAISKDVEQLKVYNLRSLRWESGVVGSILFGNYEAYILEGRVYNISTWIALLLSRVLRKKVFLWGHGWKRKEHGFKLKLRRLFYSQASGLLVYGKKAQNIAISCGISASKIAIVNNSIYSRESIETLPLVDQKTLSGLGLDENSLTLIVSCRLTSRHALDLLAEAIDLLPSDYSMINVIVIGDGSERQKLSEIFRKVRCHEFFAGPIYSVTELSSYYRLADLAISPAASGLNIVQALGFGVPVVAPSEDPSSGPEEELVVEGVTGGRFTYGSADDLSTAIQEYLSDRNRLNSMGENGRQLVLENYTAEAHAQNFDAALSDWL